MRLSLAPIAVAIQATASAAQSAFSDIRSDDEFVSRLDIDAAVRDHVFNALNTTRNSDPIDTETANLACTIASFVFGTKLNMPDGNEFGDLVDNNWSVICLPTIQACTFAEMWILTKRFETQVGNMLAVPSMHSATRVQYRRLTGTPNLHFPWKPLIHSEWRSQPQHWVLQHWIRRYADRHG